MDCIYHSCFNKKCWWHKQNYPIRWKMSCTYKKMLLERSLWRSKSWSKEKVTHPKWPSYNNWRLHVKKKINQSMGTWQRTKEQLTLLLLCLLYTYSLIMEIFSQMVQWKDVLTKKIQWFVIFYSSNISLLIMFTINCLIFVPFSVLWPSFTYPKSIRPSKLVKY